MKKYKCCQFVVSLRHSFFCKNYKPNPTFSRKPKYEFTSDDKGIAKVIDGLEKQILKRIGKPCKSLAVGCFGCQIWSGFNNLKLRFY